MHDSNLIKHLAPLCDPLPLIWGYSNGPAPAHEWCTLWPLSSVPVGFQEYRFPESVEQLDETWRIEVVSADSAEMAKIIRGRIKSLTPRCETKDVPVVVSVDPVVFAPRLNENGRWESRATVDVKTRRQLVTADNCEWIEKVNYKVDYGIS